MFLITCDAVVVGDVDGALAEPSQPDIMTARPANAVTANMKKNLLTVIGL
jgi:hypothetical protein